jgi:hypothetical protein
VSFYFPKSDFISNAIQLSVMKNMIALCQKFCETELLEATGQGLKPSLQPDGIDDHPDNEKK